MAVRGCRRRGPPLGGAAPPAQDAGTVRGRRARRRVVLAVRHLERAQRMAPSRVHAKRDGGKVPSLTRGRFLLDQFLAMNPLTFLVSLPGLAWSLIQEEGGPRRIVGIVFLTVFAILLANPHTKAEYIAAAYPMLFACGAVAIERMRRPWGTAAVWVLSGNLVVSGAILAPLAMPILPVNTYIGYSRSLGMAPGTADGQGARRIAAVLRRHARMGRAREEHLPSVSHHTRVRAVDHGRLRQ